MNDDESEPVGFNAADAGSGGRAHFTYPSATSHNPDTIRDNPDRPRSRNPVDSISLAIFFSLANSATTGIDVTDSTSFAFTDADTPWLTTANGSAPP